MPRRLLTTITGLATMVLVAIAYPAVAQPGHQGAAQSVVEDLHAQLLDVMKHANKQGYAGRYKQLQPVIEKSFNLPALAQLSVHGYWDDFTPVQKEKFIAAFTRLSIATYARRFDGYNNESFKTLGVSDSARGDRIVRTQLLKSDGDTVSLDYVLRANNEDQWRIINVVAQGVSDLALKRGQYTGVLKKQGVDGFLKRIKKQVGALPKVPE